MNDLFCAIVVVFSRYLENLSTPWSDLRLFFTCSNDKLTMDVMSIEKIRSVGAFERQSRQIPYPLR